MSKYYKHVIYDDIHVDVDDYAELFADIESERGEPLDDETRWEIYADAIRDWWDDERMNLNKRLDADIVALADLGLWNGRRTGYKIIGNNLADIMYTECDYSAVYYDGHNIRSDGIHHDGQNHVLYRVFRSDITWEQRDRFLNEVYNGNADERMIRRYTRSLAPEVCDVYGWPLPPHMRSARKNEKEAAAV